MSAPIKRVLVMCFLFASVKCDGYWEIELSPQTITSVPFGGGHISVWEHAVTKGRYYAMPLVYLLKDTANIVDNILTGDTELEFQVLMWSLEAREVVHRHLQTHVNSSIEQNQVEMLPMEKIRIVWKNRIRPLSPDFKLIDRWKSNTHLPSTVFFRFVCTERPKCEQLKETMKTNPRVFYALEIEYFINGQRSARRSLTVTGNHLLRGRLFSKMINTSPRSEGYLTADDLKTVVSESVSNVIGSIVTDSDYVDTGDDVGVKDVLMAELSRQEVSSKEFQPHMWESVFWDPTWARPDKLTKYLNKVLEKDTNDTRNFLLNESERSSSGEGGGGVKFIKFIEVNANAAGSSSSKSKVQREDVLNTLLERHNDIEWTGEIFRMKPMKLYRLNLSVLNTSRNVATANIQVHRYEAVQSIKLRLDNPGTSLTPSLTPQLVETRFNAKLKATATQTEQKLQTNKADAEQRIAAVDTKVMNNRNAVNERLAAIDGRLRGLPGWPSGGYCILASGVCPARFVRREAYISYSRSDHAGFGRIGNSSSTHDSFYLAACCRSG